MLPHVEAYLRSKIKRTRVLDRVLAANQDLQEGYLIRGWHRKPTAGDRLVMSAWMSKGQVIRKQGRAYWDLLPHGLKYRDGRRQYVHLRTLMHVPEPRPDRYAAVYALLRKCWPGRRYASDPPGAMCVVIDGAEWAAAYGRRAWGSDE